MGKGTQKKGTCKTKGGRTSVVEREEKKETPKSGRVEQD